VLQAERQSRISTTAPPSPLPDRHGGRCVGTIGDPATAAGRRGGLHRDQGRREDICREQRGVQGFEHDRAQG